MKEFWKKKNGHLHDFCFFTLLKKGEGILPTFAMWSTQMRGIHHCPNSNFLRYTLYLRKFEIGHPISFCNFRRTTAKWAKKKELLNAVWLKRHLFGYRINTKQHCSWHDIQRATNGVKREHRGGKWPTMVSQSNIVFPPFIAPPPIYAPSFCSPNQWSIHRWIKWFLKMFSR